MPVELRVAHAARTVFIALFLFLGAAVQAHALPGDNAFESAGLSGTAQRLVTAAAAPPGVTESVVWSGLTAPTAISFAPDGRVFVAEKAGRIKVFDSLADPTPTIWADFDVPVHDFWDRGFLGMALDPQFTIGRPYVYALYPYNKAPNSTQVPRWPDGCPTPPGATDDGCVITGRLSRFTANGTETVLIEDFCQQYPSHSIGSLAFGEDGALYVSAGDGASFNWADYGQDGNPRNPCGDPPGGVGGAMTPPTAEGGALRSQDVRTTSDPTGLDGAILRVDPDTGDALPDNPNAGSPDPNARRIVAYGLRNPFRITIRPGTNEVWAGDVGWTTWEEIDRIPNPTAGMRNFGWPCYEGNARQSGYDNLNLNLCETLYQQGASAHATPYYTYNHGARPVAGEACPVGSSSISGLAFYPPGGSLGPAYEGALFFSDYSRNCIWVMMRGANGLPDPGNIQTFQAGAAGPVQLTVGPGGDLYYVDMSGGTIRRFRGTFSNAVPSAVATATPSAGAVPLSVSFDGRGSSDPNPGDTLTYAWDLDGDGEFDDSTSPTPSRTYTTPGAVTVRLRVTDQGGLSDTDAVTVTAGTPPTATIDSPAAGTTWRSGDTIPFSGSATDFQGNPIAGSSLTWRINLEHCSRLSTNCHTHVLQSLPGATGSFVAPEHEYPSHLELQLTARDAFGLERTVTRRLDPLTVPVTVRSDPPGAQLTLGTESAAAPFTLDVIQGSRLAMTAPASTTIGGVLHDFTGWSDGGERTHDIVPGAAPETYTATYARSTAPARIAGTEVVGLTGSEATVGRAEVYRTTATADGRVTSIRIRLAPSSTATRLVLGLYADTNGQPTTLLASGRNDSPQADAWNEVTITDGPTLELGTPYWISLLNPVGSTGVLRWHDRAGATGGAEQGSASGTLSALPQTWAAGPVWSDGPLSAYVMGVPPGPPPPPSLAVSPGALSFSGVSGGANAAAKTLSVSNAGGGALSFTVSDDAPWLSVSPASGSAPRDLTVSVNTSGLAPGTHTATVRVESSGVDGSPKLIPVTLTLEPPQPPALSVTPSSGLAFSVVEGGSAPAAQNLAIANTGGGTLSFTAVDDAAWLAASPASGTAPATVSVSVNPAGLVRGTYSGSVRIEAAGATGSPVTVPVALTVTAPATGLVGAWGFDEPSGSTTSDASGSGNGGTISGAARTTGRNGGGLSFDGVNDWVTVADAPSLDLTTGMTLEAWVRPSNVSYWRTVVLKEQPGQLAYALYASTDNGRPSGHVYTTRDVALQTPSAVPTNTWSHLAMTWDGLTIRMYVNGTQVASSALTGTAVTSSSPLRMGGNGVWDEWFSGTIDDVRVYNRALTAAQIAGDRDTPVGGGGATLAAASRAVRTTSTRKATKSRRLTRDGGRRRAHRPRWLNKRVSRKRHRANQAVGRR
jgi:glucose/arabinose dehydrogenase/PKD repeat protein